MENKIIINEYNARWDCNMPIGNGYVGAMIPGNPRVGIITLNQDSIWYGAHKERDNKDAKKYVNEIRSLLKQGKVKAADKLCYMAMTSSPKYFGAYEPMGELWAVTLRTHILTQNLEAAMSGGRISMNFTNLQ